jgi:hypothetical protein
VVVAAMSDPTPTDVQALVDRLIENADYVDPLIQPRTWRSLREAADALTALRLDVQRITEERDEARQSMLDANGRAADRLEAINELDAELDQLKADRDAQVREAFLAGRFGRALPSGWTFTEPEYAHNADEAFAAYLRERQDGKESGHGQ